MAIGIFDSGLGGLTVLDAIRKKLPALPLVYMGDNAMAPYGVRDAEDVYNLTTRAVERLWQEGCDLVILACNTASAAALRRMQEAGLPEHKRVLGVFVPLIEALTERQWGTVREDYSASGNAWETISHDMARSKAYRLGEEGIGGISDNKQHVCFAFAFWASMNWGITSGVSLSLKASKAGSLYFSIISSIFLHFQHICNIFNNFSIV